MGIRGLERIIKQNDGYNPNILRKNLNDFSGKYICIDTSEFIVRSLIKDKDYHVSGILNLLEKCLRNNIIPLFVFDGKPPKEKRNVLNERQKKKDKAVEKIKKINKESQDLLEINDLIFKLNELQSSPQSFSNEYIDTEVEQLEINNVNNLKQAIISRINSSSNLIEITTPKTSSPVDSIIDNSNSNNNDVFDFENTDDLMRNFELKLIELSNEKKKMKKKCHNYNDKHINDIKGLFNLFSIPYIESKCESDFVCTALCKLGIVDAVVSNDMDFIVLGCPVIIRNMNFKNDIVDVYYYDNICENLGVNNFNLIELSMLLGCDYCNRIINIKNKYVFDIYTKFNNLEYLVNNIDNLHTYFKENKINISDEILEYLEDEKLALDTSININKIKSMFDINISIIELELLICNSIDLSNCFTECKNTLNNLYHNDKLFNDIVDYCYNNCNGLNYQLINKKCALICNRLNNLNTNINNYNYSSNNYDLELQIKQDINNKYIKNINAFNINKKNYKYLNNTKSLSNGVYVF